MEKELAERSDDAIARVKLAITRIRLGISSREESPAVRTDASQDQELHFVLANYYGVLNRPDEVMRQVEIMLQIGWRNYVWLKIHPDMMSLDRDRRVQALFARLIK